VVLTLPMAGLLKEKLPGCRIIFLGRTYTEPVVKLSKYVDGFLNYDLIENQSGGASALKDLHADVIIHVFPRREIALAAKRAGIKVRAGTTNRLYHWFTCNRLIRLSRKRSDLHEAQLNIKLISFLGFTDIVSTEEIPRYYGIIKPDISETAKYTDAARKNIILHPKSKGSAKEWGLSNYIRLVELLDHSEYKVFVCGTEADRKEMTELLALKEVIDLTGRFTLQQYISFIAASDALIAASTGPLHIAAALGKRAIGLFSSKRPIHPGRWKPLGEHALAVTFSEQCEQCSAGNMACNCITKIEPSRILSLLP
jgi:heptosyltransferase III